jgi:hypothetical protein
MLLLLLLLLPQVVAPTACYGIASYREQTRVKSGLVSFSVGE